MAERKTLTITQVNEVQKVGDKQIPKLSFKAEDGLTYFTFKQSLFETIKQGKTIIADIEITEQGEWTNRKIVQIYVDGQPIASKSSGRTYGKSPEELELSAKSYALSYAKDLAVAQVIPLEDITEQADTFYKWLKGNGDKPTPPAPTQGLKKGSGAQESKEDKPAIDMDWLKESLEKLNWADVGKWLKEKYPEAKGVSVRLVVASLTREHQEEFVAEVQRRLEIPEDIFSQ